MHSIAEFLDAEEGLLWLVAKDASPVTSETDPFVDIGYVQNQPACYLKEDSEGWLRLFSLYVPVPHRRQGYGEAVLMAAIQEAGRRKLPLFIEANPFGTDPGPRSLLMDWYTRYGFTRFSGHPFAMVWRDPMA